MEGYTFSTRVRVRFADTDAQGIAHNAAYPVWFEVARVEYLREYAGGYQTLRDRGIEALVLESYCRYRVPARFDDLLSRLQRRVDGLLHLDLAVRDERRRRAHDLPPGRRAVQADGERRGADERAQQQPVAGVVHEAQVDVRVVDRRISPLRVMA